MLRGRWLGLWLRAVQAWDRRTLRRLARQHAGVEIDPAASTNFAVARFELSPGAKLRIGPGVVTERLRDELHIVIESGGEVVIGEDTWLRTQIGPIRLFAYEGGTIDIARRCWLNACHLSAKRSIRLETGVGVGPGSRIFDSDQHALDEKTPERPVPVHIGEHVWITTDVTVLKGVEIGDSSVIGARSVVTRSIPEHTLAVGSPAEAVRAVGDRSQVPLLGPE